MNPGRLRQMYNQEFFKLLKLPTPYGTSSRQIYVHEKSFLKIVAAKGILCFTQNDECGSMISQSLVSDFIYLSFIDGALIWKQDN